MAVGIEVSFWSSSGCVVTAVVPCWLGLGCVSAVTMHSCTAVMRINVKKKNKPDATLSQLFFCISPSTAGLITPESLHPHTMAEHVSGKSSGNNFAAFGMLSKRIRNLSESISIFKTECIEFSGKILL